VGEGLVSGIKTIVDEGAKVAGEGAFLGATIGTFTGGPGPGTAMGGLLGGAAGGAVGAGQGFVHHIQENGKPTGIFRPRE
jgi:hypothetical protein